MTLKPSLAIKALAAAMLWMIALTLMVVASFLDSPMLSRWALLSAMAGCTLILMLTIDLVIRRALDSERKRTADLLDQERHRTEELLERIAAHFAEREHGLRSVRQDAPY